MNIDQTVLDDAWLRQNKQHIEAIIPATWTHASTANPKIVNGLKELGVGIHNDNDRLHTLAGLTAKGVLLVHQKEPWLIKLNHRHFDYAPMQ